MISLWGIFNYKGGSIAGSREIIKMGESIFLPGRIFAEQLSKGSGIGWAINGSQEGVIFSANKDKSLFIILDGYISNQQEIMQSLTQRDQDYNCNSSAETVLSLFKEEGIGGFHKLNGLFAFAIINILSQETILVRDRYGARPLYYFDNGEVLLFSSILKPILSRSEVNKGLDRRALYDYFSLNYIPFNQTIFEGIKKVPPKTAMRFSRPVKEGKIFYDFNASGTSQLRQNLVQEEFEHRFRVALKRTLPEAGSYGMFLSGGLDSGAIALFLKNLRNEKIKSFGVSFKENGFDESYFAKVVADCLGLDHRVVEFPDDFPKDCPKIINLYDNLQAETSAIPLYYAAEASYGLSHILCGDSGDELIGGYPELIADKLSVVYKKIPAFIRHNLINPFVNLLPMGESPVSFDYKAKHFVIGAEYAPLAAHYYWRQVFSEGEKKQLFTKEFYSQFSDYATFEKFRESISRYNCADIFKLFELAYLNTLIPDNNMPYYYTVCSAYGLEVRYPFLDNDLVEFLLKVPFNMKVKGFTTKYLLRKVINGRLPDTVVWRKKHGFNSPVKIWIRKQLRGLFDDVFSQESLKAYPYFNPGYIRMLLDRHLKNKEENGHKLWGLFVFILWHRRHFG